ncbi:chaperone protein dnaJ 49 [Syzygium oleosum]|uniref:chaperone protein dnaJ 49 n=1 Tax=Syzygium oleosum TaxID=219896 RepID=UPI0011D23A9D|nr:chaperone protein dnaJ 49 [Syzygium oleosum]
MEGNKDEALRCVGFAVEAIVAGNRERALRFIRIARRLDRNLPVSVLLDQCDKLGLGPEEAPAEKKPLDDESNKEPGPGKYDGGSDAGKKKYGEEHVQLIGQIKRTRDYYALLGLEKGCSLEEIKKAYRKLSLRVHPDKNKAPGAEEAFKKVSKAFKCLSDDGSRRQYDQTGFVEEFEHNQRRNVRRRRRRTGNDLFGDDFDPDEIFRGFFRQEDPFRTSHVYRTGRAGGYRREDSDVGGFSLMVLLQILPFLIILLLSYLPFTEPEYSLFKNYAFEVSKATEKHGVEFFVKSSAFDNNYPPGSPARANIEDIVIKDYKSMLFRYCHIERQRRQWNKNLPTPNCNKLQNLGVA